MAAPRLVDDLPGRVLAVYAHPDDAEVSCGGTLARWAGAGAEVHLLVCARGDKGSTDPAGDPQALAARRADEVAAAATVLGLAGHANLGWPDGEFDNTPEVRRAIVAAVRQVRPDVVVCPDPTAVFFGDRYYNHHDHRVTGWATLDAVAPAAGNPHYFPEAGPGHQVAVVYLTGTLEPNAWVDVSGSLDAKVKAVACHRSQLADGGEWLGEFLRQRAEEAGREAGAACAEAFRRLTLAP